MQDRKFICPCYRHEQDIAETGHCICHLFVDDDYEPVVIQSPPVPAEGNPWPDIVIYGAYWCKDTVNTVTFLNGHGIPYDFVDVDSDPQGADKLRGWTGGKLSTPTLDVEGRIVRVPSNEELAELLGLAPTRQS